MDSNLHALTIWAVIGGKNLPPVVMATTIDIEKGEIVHLSDIVDKKFLSKIK